MLTFKLIRKIGKILRGGAGRKEIFLGTLFGVLIGFNPDFNFTLLVAFLIALLLNANFSFVVFGAAVGKLLSLPLAAISFNIGFALIHNMGLEGVFRSLCNTPITALMDLNVYALIGSLPIALVVGIVLGSMLGAAVIKIRQKMLEADQHEIIGKTFGNKVSRLLLRLAFGKSKLTLDDEVPKQAPLFRKSGLILVGVLVAIAALLEVLLFDIIIRRGIESSISAATGAEVNIEDADFSLAGGEIHIKGLQVTDPEKPTHNMVQIDTLVADLDVSELLTRHYAIDLLAGSTLKRDVPRATPGAVYEKKPAAAKTEEAEAPGKPLGDYFAQAEQWKKYGDQAYDYLKTRKDNAESAARGETPKASKDTALADAEKLGYLRAAADLASDRPAWTIHEIRIENVELGNDIPQQTLGASEVSSHPELNGKPTTVSLTPAGGIEPSALLVLRFDDPVAMHAIDVHFKGVALGNAIETSDSFPVDVQDGKADIDAAGNFSTDELDVPFTILVHDLQANVEEGKKVMGMDADTASEVLSSVSLLEIDGVLGGTLLLPRVSIDYDKLTANMKEALVAAGKKELANRADAEMDKAKAELSKKAGEELNKALGGEEGESVQEQAKGALRKLF